jgi:hypothetical protein
VLLLGQPLLAALLLPLAAAYRYEGLVAVAVLPLLTVFWFEKNAQRSVTAGSVVASQEFTAMQKPAGGAAAGCSLQVCIAVLMGAHIIEY